MKELRKEMERANIRLQEARNNYLKHTSKQNYDWWKMCEQYYNGLKKAFDLIEGE
mgnify:CR=1 FL=1